MKKFIFILLFVPLFLKLNAQFDPRNIAIEDIAEEIASQTDEDVDYSTIFDDLQYFYDNPINLNTTNAKQLEKLHFLNDIQIKAIINFLHVHHRFETQYDLLLLPGFDAEDVQRLMAFAYIGPSEKTVEYPAVSDIFKYGRNEIYTRTNFLFEPQAGYNIPDSVIQENPDKARYLGSPYQLYLRYKFHYRDQVQWGLTAEKDAGEQFFKETQKYGFDYYSAHLQIDLPIWKIKRIVVGDYQAQFGQGLTLWSGLTFGKSAYALNVKKQPRGLRRYTSTDENRFLRGLGVTMQFNKLNISLFTSYHKIDANIDYIDTIDEEIRTISSLQTTGYHRTPTEIENKHAIGQFVNGTNITYNDTNFTVGFTFVNYHLTADLQRDISPYQTFEFQGSDIFNTGINYEAEILKMTFFGETSMSSNLGLATVDGVLIPLEHRISMVALYRNYSPYYQGIMTGALAESSGNNNEQGVYLGFEIYPLPKFKFTAYFDNYYFKWLKFRLNDVYSSGFEYLLQLDYTPSRYVTMYSRFKHEIKPQNTDGEHIDYPVDVSKWSWRYHIDFQISKTLSIRNRVEISYWKKEDEVKHGFMAYQDIRYSPSTLPLTTYFRFAVFDAPYDARIYAYENDVLYAFSVPGYYYRGFRTYLVARYKINSALTLWLKLSQFNYFDQDKLSEGTLNEIDGHTKTNLKLQLRYRF